MVKFRFGTLGRLVSAASILWALFAFSSTVMAAEARSIWQSRDQFVRIEPQESSQVGGVSPNQHPFETSADRLAAILGTLDVRLTGSKKQVPLFTQQSIEALVPHLQTSLGQAAASEDVVFAVIGLYDGLYGLAKSPKVTTGRLFYRDGRLNLILGYVHRDVNEREDRRLAPFVPGSRLKTLEGEWRLVPRPGQSPYVELRRDWVAFDENWRGMVVGVPAVVTVPAPPPLPVAAPPSHLAPPTAPAATPATSLPANPEARRAAERLMIIKELRDKGLISDDEYRAKRSEILNGL